MDFPKTAEAQRHTSAAPSKLFDKTRVWEDIPYWGWSRCFACKMATIWREGQIVWPGTLTGPPASEDMPPEVRKLYDEARAIAEKSPRAAAALLRLAADRLAIKLGGEGKTLYDRLASLKEQGLPERALRALHGIRKGGREAVHPGEIDVDEKPEIVGQLFKFLNLAVDYLITKPREMTEFDAAVP